MPVESPDVPELARRVFGDRTELAAAYVRLLVTTGIEHGLVGPREAPRMWQRHVVNCALAEPAFAPGASVADLGTGAGLPGIVLAIARPDLRVHLVEPLQRRVGWLRRSVAELGLGNVEICEGRAEAYAGRLRVRHTTARAVARLASLTEWSVPLLEPGGTLVAYKGASAAAELEADWPAMRRAGATSSVVRVYGEDLLDRGTSSGESDESAADPASVGPVEVGSWLQEPTRVVIVECREPARRRSKRSRRGPAARST